MKKLKLDLMKQSVIRLTSDETNSIIGGGKKNSDKHLGDCRYSRKHPEECMGNDGKPAICSCVSKAQQAPTLDF